METKIIKPYNDLELKFNEETGRYELTIEAINSNFGNSFKDSGVLQKRITKNSRRVYNYLFSRAFSSNNQIVNFFINRTENGRKFIKDMLFAQMEADLETGYNDIGITPTINLSNGQVIDRAVLRTNLVCVDAEEIADNNHTYFGFNLLIQTLLPAYLFTIVRNNS
mgnify:CR=1 FL=1